jgi:hypothetical protein
MAKNRLKVGYEPFVNATPGFIDDLGAVVQLFHVEFVSIDDYHPLNRSAANGRWAGALGWLHNGFVDTLEDYWYITADKIDSFRFTNPIREESFGAIYSVASVDTSVMQFNSMMANIQISVYFLMLAASCAFIVLYVWVGRVIDRPSSTDWWTVLVAAVPCFNCQATLEVRDTVTRRVIFIFIGIYVLLTTTFYQTYLLRSLILSTRVTPLTMNQIIAGVERHEYTIMFYNQDEEVESLIR